MATWAFCLAAAVAAVFSVLMVLQRSLYASAICLLVVLFQAAVLFFLSGAPLLAFLQVMIYAGAVMVLAVIVVMAAPSKASGVWSGLFLPRWLALLGLAVPFAEGSLLVWRGGLPPGVIGAGLGAEARIGPVLFGTYAVATEAVTLLMFLAALAMVAPAREASAGAPR